MIWYILTFLAGTLAGIVLLAVVSAGRDDWGWGNGTILAWMPLPEPYNPGDEE